ncbi:MAG TPA: thymidylate synthase (FAD), partial [Stellaceae bacterium]|nr:thymidylate synthase (FAD) [Stellaceae bacterium]
VYADAMLGMMERWVPLTAEAFHQYRMGGAHISQKGLAVVKRLIAGDRVSQADSGLSKREWAELMETLGRDA